MPGETTKFKIPYALGTDKPPSVPTITKAMAEKLEEKLGLVAPSQITGVAKKQLLIANASGVVTAVTASGDVTNDESGVFTIKDAAVTSRKLKPSSGLLQLSETKTLTEALVDMPGLKLEITPEVASILLVTITVTFQIPNTGIARAVLVVDGVEQEDAAEWIGNGTFGGNLPVVSQVYRVALTAAVHTIKVQARKAVGSGETKMVKRGGIAAGGGSSMLYMMHAS